MQRYPIQDTKNIVDYHHYPFFHHFHFKAQAGCIRQYLWIVKLLGKLRRRKNTRAEILRPFHSLFLKDDMF